MRFELDSGEGFVPVFPETVSFHAARHDPAEIYLQLADLSSKPQLLSPRANQRDAQTLMSRLVLGIPRYLEGVLTRLETEGRLRERALERIYVDMALLAQIVTRFLGERGGEDGPGLRMASLHLRKLLFHALDALVQRRVEPEYLAGYVAGTVDPVDPLDDLSESGFFHTMESGEPEAVDRSLLRLAERAWYRWLEDVCLDETNRAFEIEGSPFDGREPEVRRAIARDGETRVRTAAQLVPYLRRPHNRDCQRVLGKLEKWFLRQYDIHHAAVMIHHGDHLAQGAADADLVLSRHSTRNYALALGGLVAPFVGAAFGYERAARAFDVICGLELLAGYAVVAWFMLYRFCWQRNLTFFRAAVPRIAAGIIVGYLPIFFLDEMWALAQRSWALLGSVALLMGSATMLYLYIEVQRRLGDTTLAFGRARQIFILGVLQSFAIGLVVTGLVGGFMATRNWGGRGAESVEALRGDLAPFVGELPRILGFEPFYAFPTTIFIMTFLAFFIGVFLQLMWEDIPITEPL